MEFMRGIAHPIGVEVGSSAGAHGNTQALVGRLNPDREPGRLVLIHRFGADQIARSCRR